MNEINLERMKQIKIYWLSLSRYKRDSSVIQFKWESSFPEPLAKDDITVFNFIPVLFSNHQMVYYLCVATVKTQYYKVLWINN